MGRRVAWSHTRATPSHRRRSHPYPSAVETRRLTSFSHGAGCGCKLGPEQLRGVLAGLELPAAPADVLVGAETGDDAAVVRLPDGRLLVATLDYFTPIVDDAYDWGRIAATNALSDVYAMGATPLLALNVVNWPADDLPLDLLARVLQGGVDVAAAVGVPVLGGHTITDPEPKYGMVAIGLTDEEHLVRNDRAVAGATLFLTKPIGVGIVTTAIKRGVAPAAQVATAVATMTTLNADAAAASRDAGVRAGTDVTGFGLLGHLHTMLLASGVSARVRATAVPLLDGILDLARDGVVPGGAGRNLAFVEPHLVAPDLDASASLVLADPQTSGGLLVAAADAARFRDAAVRRGVACHEIGVVEPGPAGRIVVDGGFA